MKNFSNFQANELLTDLQTIKIKGGDDKYPPLPLPIPIPPIPRPNGPVIRF